jgi:hypothetical protein
MKNTLRGILILTVLFLSVSAFAATRYVTKTGVDNLGGGTLGAPWQTINYAIKHASTSDVIEVAAGTYAENVIVDQELTIHGVGDLTIITPSSGIGVTVSANNVALQNFKVTGASNHGIYAGTVSNLTITQVTATLNGTVANRSGIALQAVTTATITNVDVQSNAKHGLEIGNGSSGVSVSGGTFSSNGVPGDIQTGAGIIVYADNAATTNGTHINGAVATGNTTAGIMLYCTPGGTLNGTVIGNTLKPTLNDNGSTGAGYGTGGAAILLFGHCTNTTISANSTNNNLVNPTAGLVVLGSNASGANSPAGTVVQNCNLTGYTATSPAATMYAHSGANTLVCVNDVDATVGNSINGAASGFAVEDVLMHKIDNSALGIFRGPGTELYVTTNSGSIQRAINAAVYLCTATPPLTITKIHVNSATYNEAVIVSRALYILGEGVSQPIITPPAGSVGINVTANGVTLDNLEVTGTSGDLTKHGVWANGVNGLTIQNVYAHNNAGSGIALRGIPASPVSTVMNVTASNNKNQGLEIGNGANGVVVVGGTFSTNGTNNNLSTGGGIMLYSDGTGANEVQNIVIKGTVTANTNTTAGIYIYSAPGIITGTSIGQNVGDVITLTDNGSIAGSYGTGGAGVLVFGAADVTTISGSFTRSSVDGAGLVALGTGNTGTNSPTNISVKNSTFTGYNASFPAITLETKEVLPDYISTKSIDAVTGNTFPGSTTSAAIAGIIFDTTDNTALGKVILFIPTAPAVSHLNTELKSDSAKFSWTAPSGTLGNYEYDLLNRYGTVVASNTPTTSLSHQFAGLSAWSDSTIIFRVRAEGQGGWSAYAPDTITLLKTVVVTVAPNTPVVLNTSHDGAFLNLSSSVSLSGVSISTALDFVSELIYSSSEGTLVPGVPVNVPASLGTVTGDVLQIDAGGLSFSGTLTFSYPIVDRTKFSNTTRVSHFHEGAWADLGRVLRYDYDANPSGTGSELNITDIPSDALHIYAVFSTSSLSTIVFTTPSITSSSEYLAVKTNSLQTQSATVSTAYAQNLSVRVTNAAGDSLSGVTVYFRRPSSGASVTFTSGTPTVPPSDSVSVVTDANGIAAVSVTANSTIGSFTVVANSGSAATPLSFNLTNKVYTAILAKVKVFLQGPYSGGVLATTLNSGGLIPLSASTAYNTTTFGYTDKTVGSIPNANVVDWVLVDLRTGTASGTKVETQAGFVLNDGSIVDSDGSSDLSFSVATAGDYYIVIRHRNHLAIMSAAAVTLPNGTAYDFTTGLTQAFGGSMKSLTGGVYGMYVGDFNLSGTINAVDFSTAGYLSQSGTAGYKFGDFNFSGTVNASDGPFCISNSGLASQVP